MMSWCLYFLFFLAISVRANDDKDNDKKLEKESDGLDSKKPTDSDDKILKELSATNETIEEAMKATANYFDQLDKLLSNKTKEELETIAKDNVLTQNEKYRKFHDVFTDLPDEIKEKLPLPPIYRNLPHGAQTKIKEIFTEKSSFDEKQEKLEKLYLSLTDEEKKLVPEWTEMREFAKKEAQKSAHQTTQ